MTLDISRTRLRAPCATASRKGRAATRPALVKDQARRAGRACSSVPSYIDNGREIEGVRRPESEYHEVESHTPSRRPRRHAITHLDMPFQAFPFTRMFFVLFSLIFLPRRSFFTCGKACVRAWDAMEHGASTPAGALGVHH